MRHGEASAGRWIWVAQTTGLVLCPQASHDRSWADGSSRKETSAKKIYKVKVMKCNFYTILYTYYIIYILPGMFSCHSNSHPYCGAAGPPLPILTLWLPAPRQGIPREVTKQTTTKVAEVIESQRARLQTRGFFLLFVVHLESRKPKLARGTGHTRGNTLYVFNFWVEDRAGQQGPQKIAASEFKQILLASSTVGEARRLRMPPDSLKPQKSLTA